jgi:hypothetical protein
MFSSVIAQKVNLDTLTIDELNLYKDKAVKLRNTGRILTVSGIGVGVTGFLVAAVYAGAHEDDASMGINMSGVGILFISGLSGLTMTLVGASIWTTGGNRKAKAELTLQKFNIAPEGSMALGLGITIKF